MKIKNRDYSQAEGQADFFNGRAYRMSEQPALNPRPISLTRAADHTSLTLDERKQRGSYPGPIFLSKQKRRIDRTTLHLLMKKYGAAAGNPGKAPAFSCTEAFAAPPTY